MKRTSFFMLCAFGVSIQARKVICTSDFMKKYRLKYTCYFFLLLHMKIKVEFRGLVNILQDI